MYPNPSSSGIGQGAAQVFDTRGVMQTFMRLSAMEQQQRMIDEQSVAKMLSQFDPSKLRSPDQKEFSEKYSQLQSLYTKNKGLYRSPLKNIEAYREANNLMGDLRSLAAESREAEKVLQGAAMQMHQKNGYTPESVSKVQAYSAAPTRDIVRHNGNRMISLGDFEYIPDEIDESDLKAVVQSAGAALAQHSIEFKTTKDDPRIPENLQMQRTTTVIPEEAYGDLAKIALSRSKWKDSLEYQWKNMDVQQQNQVRLMTAKVPNIDRTNGPLMLATMLVGNYSTLDSKESFGRNEEYYRNEALKKEQRSENRADRRAAMHAAAVGSALAPIENMGLTHAGQFMGALASGDPASVNMAVAPLMALAPNMEDGAPLVWYPGSYPSADAMVDGIMPYQAERASGDDGPIRQTDTYFSMTEKDIRDAYARNSAIVGVRLKGTTKVKSGDAIVDKPTSTTYLFNPAKPGVDKAFYGMLQKEMPGQSFERGWAPGYPGFDQKMIKVPVISGKK